jgi:DNA-binding GntR family transcriptional regulator
MTLNEMNDAVLDDEDSPVLAKLDNVALRHRVYESLAGALRAGRFAPGELVTIRGLAQILGTSPMPVREAVSRLTTEGALEVLPNRTMRVPQTSIAALAELTSVRMTVEGQAAALAAENVTAEALASIQAANDHYAAAARNQDIATALAANGEFHFAIYRAAKSPLLLAIIEMLWMRGGPYIAAEMRAMSKGGGVMLNDRGTVHHEEMLAALADRDPNAMRKALCADIGDAAVWLREHILKGAAALRRGP